MSSMKGMSAAKYIWYMRCGAHAGHQIWTQRTCRRAGSERLKLWPRCKSIRALSLCPSSFSQSAQVRCRYRDLGAASKPFRKRYLRAREHVSHPQMKRRSAHAAYTMSHLPPEEACHQIDTHSCQPACMPDQCTRVARSPVMDKHVCRQPT